MVRWQAVAPNAGDTCYPDANGISGKTGIAPFLFTTDANVGYTAWARIESSQSYDQIELSYDDISQPIFGLQPNPNTGTGGSSSGGNVYGYANFNTAPSAVPAQTNIGTYPITDGVQWLAIAPNPITSRTWQLIGTVNTNTNKWVWSNVVQLSAPSTFSIQNSSVPVAISNPVLFSSPDITPSQIGSGSNFILSLNNVSGSISADGSYLINIGGNQINIPLNTLFASGSANTYLDLSSTFPNPVDGQRVLVMNSSSEFVASYVPYTGFLDRLGRNSATPSLVAENHPRGQVQWSSATNRWLYLENDDINVHNPVQFTASVNSSGTIDIGVVGYSLGKIEPGNNVSFTTNSATGNAQINATGTTGSGTNTVVIGIQGVKVASGTGSDTASNTITYYSASTDDQVVAQISQTPSYGSIFNAYGTYLINNSATLPANNLASFVISPILTVKKSDGSSYTMPQFSVVSSVQTTPAAMINFALTQIDNNNTDIVLTNVVDALFGASITISAAQSTNATQINWGGYTMQATGSVAQAGGGFLVLPTYSVNTTFNTNQKFNQGSTTVFGNSQSADAAKNAVLAINPIKDATPTFAVSTSGTTTNVVLVLTETRSDGTTYQKQGQFSFTQASGSTPGSFWSYDAITPNGNQITTNLNNLTINLGGNDALATFNMAESLTSITLSGFNNITSATYAGAVASDNNLFLASSHRINYGSFTDSNITVSAGNFDLGANNLAISIYPLGNRAVVTQQTTGGFGIGTYNYNNGSLVQSAYSSLFYPDNVAATGDATIQSYNSDTGSGTGLVAYQLQSTSRYKVDSFSFTTTSITLTGTIIANAAFYSQFATNGSNTLIAPQGSGGLPPILLLNNVQVAAFGATFNNIFNQATGIPITDSSALDIATHRSSYYFLFNTRTTLGIYEFGIDANQIPFTISYYSIPFTNTQLGYISFLNDQPVIILPQSGGFAYKLVANKSVNFAAKVSADSFLSRGDIQALANFYVKGNRLGYLPVAKSTIQFLSIRGSAGAWTYAASEITLPVNTTAQGLLRLNQLNLSATGAPTAISMPVGVYRIKVAAWRVNDAAAVNAAAFFRFSTSTGISASPSDSNGIMISLIKNTAFAGGDATDNTYEDYYIFTTPTNWYLTGFVGQTNGTLAGFIEIERIIVL